MLCAISGSYPQIPALERLGFEVLRVPPNRSVHTPVSDHADIQLCSIDGTVFVAKEQPELACALRLRGYRVRMLRQKLRGIYPGDCLLACAVVGHYALLHPGAVAPKVQEYVQQQGYQIVPVRQGYARCAVLPVGADMVITADPGIAAALRRVGIEPMQIRPGGISLPGYDTGFIGGCGGMPDPHTLIVSGDLRQHPDYKQIHTVLQRRRITLYCLPGPLTDVGGLLFFC